MAQNGKIYRHYATKFRTMDRETRMKCCLGSAMQVFQMCESMGMDESSSIALVELCAQFGVNYDGVLTADERKFAKEFFEAFIEDCDMNEIYEQLKQPLSDDFYGMLKFFVREAPMESLHLFLLILCFALSDEKVEDALALQMELIFAIPLMQHFSQSGLESVPDVEEPVQISLTDLEARIVEFYQKNNSMQYVDDIAAVLPSYNKSSLVRALNSLCDKGVLKKVPMALGDLYSPVSTVDLSSLHIKNGTATSRKSPEKDSLEELRKNYEQQKSAYSAERRRIRALREAEEEKELTSALAQEKAKLEQNIRQAFREAELNYEQQKKEILERRQAQQSRLVNARFFQFSEKSAAKREIEITHDQMDKIERTFAAAKENYDQDMQNVDNQLKKQEWTIKRAIEAKLDEKFPYPEAPEKPEKLRQADAEVAIASYRQALRNGDRNKIEYYCALLLSVMDTCPATCSELKNRDSELEEKPTHYIAHALSRMANDGVVNQTTERGKMLFVLV